VKKNPIRYYPIFLDLRNRLVVVIGGGTVATRKVQNLLQCGATLTVISPKLSLGLTELEQQQRIKIIRRVYQRGDLSGAELAFAATDRPAINQAVAKEAKNKGIYINVADRSAPGDFIVPAIFSEKNIAVAVSTHGENPALAVATRDRLKTYLKQISSS